MMSIGRLGAVKFGEMEKFQFYTKGCCLICLEIIPTSNDKEEGDKSASISGILKYLRINLTEVFSGGTGGEPSNLPNEAVMGADMRAEFCDECAHLMGSVLEQFNRLEQLRIVRMKLNYNLDKIRNTIVGASNAPNTAVQFQKRMSSDVYGFVFKEMVARLREQLVNKCSTNILSNEPGPKIVLKKINGDLNSEQTQKSTPVKYINRRECTPRPSAMFPSPVVDTVTESVSYHPPLPSPSPASPLPNFSLDAEEDEASMPTLSMVGRQVRRQSRRVMRKNSLINMPQLQPIDDLTSKEDAIKPSRKSHRASLSRTRSGFNSGTDEVPDLTSDGGQYSNSMAEEQNTNQEKMDDDTTSNTLNGRTVDRMTMRRRTTSVGGTIHAYKHKCEPCNKVFVTPSGLFYHRNKVHRGIRYPCTHPGCGASYTAAFNLNLHWKVHHTNGNQPNVQRKAKTRSRNFNLWKKRRGLHRRRGIPSTAPKYKCQQCDKEYFHKGTLQIHCKTAHLGIRYQCMFPGCLSVYSQKYNLHLHHRKRHSGWVPSGEISDRNEIAGSAQDDKTEGGRNPGSRSNSAVTPLKEQNQNGESSKLNKVRVGMQARSIARGRAAKKWIKCNICQRSFRTPRALGTHQRWAHSGGNSFKTNSQINTTVAENSSTVTRQDERTEISTDIHELGQRCMFPGCGRIYINETFLKRHQELQHPDWNKQEEGDGSSESPEGLHPPTPHEISNTVPSSESTSDLKCNICQLSFKSQNSLNNHHQRVHKGFKCDDCGKVYKTKQGLDKHTRSVHIRARFQCTIPGCMKTYTTKHNLARHLRTKGAHTSVAISQEIESGHGSGSEQGIKSGHGSGSEQGDTSQQLHRERSEEEEEESTATSNFGAASDSNLDLNATAAAYAMLIKEVKREISDEEEDEEDGDLLDLE